MPFVLDASGKPLDSSCAAQDMGTNIEESGAVGSSCTKPGFAKKADAQATKGPIKVWTLKEVQDAKEFVLIFDRKVYKVPDAWRTGGFHPGGQILLDDSRGLDVTLAMRGNHRPELLEPILKRFYAGDMVSDYQLSEAERDFMELQDLAHSDKWFKTDAWFYIAKIVWYWTLLATSICCVVGTFGDSYWVRVVLAGFLMGFYWQQLAFIGHDLGHSGVTHDRATDELLGTIFGNASNGISMGWWKATHHVHHLVCNSVEYDPDIQHMPVFAVTEKFFKGIFSKYHFRTFPFDGPSQFLVKRQHYLYYPIMAVARFNLYAQSFVLLLNAEDYKKKGGHLRKTELSLLGVFWVWFSYLLTYFTTTSEAVTFLLLSHAIAGLLHVQITISHFPMPVVDGIPMASLNFIETHVSGSIDVDCSEGMDWFHGGLQFQVVHHLFPRLPRHNLRKFRDKHLLAYFKKHGIEYKIADFFECNRKVLRCLRDVGEKVDLWQLGTVG